MTFKQAHNLHVCGNIHFINGKCMSSTEVGRGKLPTNTVIRLFPNSSNGFPHAFILSPCGRSMPLNFVISNIFCSSWDLNYATAACEHLARWPRMRITQNLKPARVKKYPMSCNRCKTSPTCSSFSLTSMLSWIIFISHPEHTVAGGREQLCRLMTCSDGRISVVSVCSWRFIFRLCVCGGGVTPQKFGLQWGLLVWQWLTQAAMIKHLSYRVSSPKGQHMVATGQSELCG